MHITKFKKGDVVTRSTTATYFSTGCKDGSYIGEPMTYVGYDETSKIIAFIHPDFGAKTLSAGSATWDSGWEYYPMELSNEMYELAEKIRPTKLASH